MKTQLLNSMKNEAVNYVMRTYGSQVIDAVKSRYGFSVNVEHFEKSITLANEWLAKYDKNHSLRNKDSATGNVKDTSYLFKISNYAFVIVNAGYRRSKFELLLLSSDRNNSDYGNQDLNIYIFGKDSRRYYKELTNKLDLENSITLNQYDVSGDNSGGDRMVFNSIISDLHQRNINTLFFDDEVKERVLSYIKTFNDNETIYKKRDILYKTGILLYGQPGTGKSSLANAIASYCKDDLIIVDMNSFNTLNVSMLTQSINADDKQYVILLEDIDTIFNSLDRTSENIDKEEKEIINKMLQFLDSNSSPNNVIFIATTNHIEKLDAAIVREGRFDCKIEVGPICKETAIKMIKSFGIEEEKSINSILNKVENFPINQSKLQSLILDSFNENKKEENAEFNLDIDENGNKIKPIKNFIDEEDEACNE